MLPVVESPATAGGEGDDAIGRRRSLLLIVALLAALFISIAFPPQQSSSAPRGVAPPCSSEARAGDADDAQTPPNPVKNAVDGRASAIGDVAADWEAADEQHASGWWRGVAGCCPALRRLYGAAVGMHPDIATIAAFAADDRVATVVESGSRTGAVALGLAAPACGGPEAANPLSGRARPARRFASLAPKAAAATDAILTCASVCGGSLRPEETPRRHIVAEGSPLAAPIPFTEDQPDMGRRPIDMYVVDSVHNGDHTTLELSRIAPVTQHFILVLGASRFGEADEAGHIAAVGWGKFARNFANANGSSAALPKRPQGVRAAIELFLQSGPGTGWRIARILASSAADGLGGIVALERIAGHERGRGAASEFDPAESVANPRGDGSVSPWDLKFDAGGDATVGVPGGGRHAASALLCRHAMWELMSAHADRLGHADRFFTNRIAHSPCYTAAAATDSALTGTGGAYAIARRRLVDLAALYVLPPGRRDGARYVSAAPMMGLLRAVVAHEAAHARDVTLLSCEVAGLVAAVAGADQQQQQKARGVFVLRKPKEPHPCANASGSGRDSLGPAVSTVDPATHRWPRVALVTAEWVCASPYGVVAELVKGAASLTTLVVYGGLGIERSKRQECVVEKLAFAGFSVPGPLVRGGSGVAFWFRELAGQGSGKRKPAAAEAPAEW